MESSAQFKITLEHVHAANGFHTFRVGFSNCDSRLLLVYPQVTGIRFLDFNDEELATWHTRYLASEPLDDFVLTPQTRISFELNAYVSGNDSTEIRWSIGLPLGKCRARFRYHVDEKREWYDYLAKRSRFAQQTLPWSGTMESDTIELDNKIAPKNPG